MIYRCSDLDARVEGSRDTSVNNVTKDITDCLLNGVSNSVVKVSIFVSNWIRVNARIFTAELIIVVVFSSSSMEGSAVARVIEVVAHFVLVVVANCASLTFEIVGFSGAGLECLELLINKFSVDWESFLTVNSLGFVASSVGSVVFSNFEASNDVLFRNDNFSLSNEVRFGDGISWSVFTSMSDVNVVMAFILFPSFTIFFPSLFPLTGLVNFKAISWVREGSSNNSTESRGLKGTWGG